jgi:hypothetical protein
MDEGERGRKIGSRGQGGRDEGRRGGRREGQGECSRAGGQEGGRVRRAGGREERRWEKNEYGPLGGLLSTKFKIFFTPISFRVSKFEGFKKTPKSGKHPASWKK